MSKVKKFFISIGVFFTGLTSKVFGTIPSVYEGTPPAPLYGPPQDYQLRAGLRIGKMVLPIVLFIIGLVVLLNKKISKKVKSIVVSILVVLGILVFVVSNYILKRF